MKRWLFENLGLKILALLIALCLWAYVGSRQVLDTRVIVHLQLTDIPVGMTVDSNVKTAIPVVLTGRKESILDLDADDLSAIVSLRGYVPGKQDFAVHPVIKPLPPGVTANTPDVTVHLVPVVVKAPSLAAPPRPRHRKESE
jgi:YbbR domain-containing protein